MEAIAIARGVQPLEWDDDACASDDSPVRSLAIDDAAAAFLCSPEAFDHGNHVQAWCDIRWHLRTWLQRPEGIGATLGTPMSVLGDAVPSFRYRDDTVGDVVMPEALVRILAGHGVDPRAFGAIAAWRPGKWTVHLGELRLDVDSALAGDAETWRISGYIHPDGIGIWDLIDGHVSLYDHLPETASQALIGEPLCRVVSHPMIDPLDLVVSGVSQWTGTVLHYRDRNVALRDMVIEE